MNTTFVSYASADRHEAASICEELEARGAKCWMAARDVRPGENYQEAIVQAIRQACGLVLVFSKHANRSNEIKKELSLASRFQKPVIALRISDVEPSDAFAYELSTRQWIDLFADRTRALDSVTEQLAEQGGISGAVKAAAVGILPTRPVTHRAMSFVAAFVALVAIASGGWWFITHHAAASSMSKANLLQVRLTGFERLSPDVPPGTDAALQEELTAALADEGVVKVSNATAAPSGTGPAFALSGTVRRDGTQIRIVLQLVNERTGGSLWSQSLAYDANALSRVPRLVAANAGSVLRCGLFGFSTYPNALPDGAMADYLTECFHHYSLDSQNAKGLDAARKVVSAVPDFSWGWSGVAVSAVMTAQRLPSAEAAPYLHEALAAADRAIALDPTNSEAFAWKSFAIDPAALFQRESLMREALKVRALSCGCEHNIYGAFLLEVGRNTAALAEFRRAVDTLALEFESQEALAIALTEAGDDRGAKEHVDAAVDLTGDPGQRAGVMLILAPINQEYAAALAGLDEPTLPYSQNVIAAWRTALQALAANRSGDKAAIATLVALPDDGQEATITVGLLGALGANREAVALIERRPAAGEPGVRSLLFVPSMDGARRLPEFPAVVERLGLMRYWRQSKTRPDACTQTNQPAFCSKI